ncbi:MAG: YHYH protein [Bermanella sp.]
MKTPQAYLVIFWLVSSLTFLLSGCGASTGITEDTSAGDSSTEEDTNTDASTGTSSSLTLNSSVMTDGGTLPTTYSCDGDGISPPLSWSGAPSDTQEYALIMHHVPGPGDAHWYWVMYNLDDSVTELGAGESLGTLGSNSVNSINEYAPPCSQGPGEKEYIFTLYALSTTPDVSNSSSVDRDTLLSAILDITLESVEFTVNFERGNTDSSESTNCERVQSSVSDAGFNDSVVVMCDDNYAYITSDTYPDHDLMNGITGTNEQIPVPAVDYASPIKLNPALSNVLTSIDAAVGVAVNGVPIYDYSAAGDLDIYNYDENLDTLVLGQLDSCGGHAGRGDDYHYHAAPTCMQDAINDLNDTTILGWGYDGYPLYGNNNPDGSAINEGALDVCNGQIDADFGYRYHTSNEAPYIIQCLVGEVDTSILPRVASLISSNPQMRNDLTPPQGGVTNLSHTVSDNGTRTMTYSHDGSDYYVVFSPSTSGENCYNFSQKTVSNGGIEENGVFCR